MKIALSSRVSLISKKIKSSKKRRISYHSKMLLINLLFLASPQRVFLKKYKQTINNKILLHLQTLIIQILGSYSSNGDFHLSQSLEMQILLRFLALPRLFLLRVNLSLIPQIWVIPTKAIMFKTNQKQAKILTRLMRIIITKMMRKINCKKM